MKVLIEYFLLPTAPRSGVCVEMLGICCNEVECMTDEHVRTIICAKTTTVASAHSLSLSARLRGRRERNAMQAGFWHWSTDGSQQSMDSEAFHSPLCHQILVEEVPTFHVTTSADFHALAWVSVLWNVSTKTRQ